MLIVQTVDLDDLYFEDPNALSEAAQLFTIGVLLIEIAQRILLVELSKGPGL